MGREIIFEVRKGDKVVWPDPNNIYEALYVCGRDDATGYIAQLVQDQVDDILDSDEEMTVDNLPDDAYALFLTCNDYDKYLEIKKELKYFYDKDMKEIQKAKDTLEDLREARRHTTTFKDFKDFTNSMENTQEWIDENDYSRAGSLIKCLDECYNKMLDLVNEDDNPDRNFVINEYKVAIIWSE